ncbi:MAG: hypothetical protein IKW18_02815 [Clostridia bacterium]|nr:hypothetical protein [Clostridia bacterium]
MKKLFSLLLAILLCMTLFTSCKTKFEPQSAKELWDKINETMDALDGYESNGTGSLTLNVSGVKLSMNLKMKSIISGLQNGNYYYYYSTDSTLSTTANTSLTGESGEVLHEISIEAFDDGKMFVSSESDERSQKLYSPLTKEEFLAYREKKDKESADINYSDCKNAAFSQNEDGTWSLQYSGYTKKTINQLIKSFNMDSADFDFEIEDLNVSILADSEFHAKEIKIQFIFDEETEKSTSPVFEMSMTYSNYNAITPIKPDSSEYTEVEDCRFIYDLEDMLKALEEKKDGLFYLELEQVLSVPSLNQTQSYTEIDTVIYGEKNGSYFYEITAIAGSDVFDISYENGKQTISVSGQGEVYNQTEKEAKEYVRSLINTAAYAPEYVSSITKRGDGIYEIQCKYPDTSAYTPIFEAYAGKLTEMTQVITFTIKNGSIVEIENYTLAKGTASNGYQSLEMRIELTSTNIFEK